MITVERGRRVLRGLLREKEIGAVQVSADPSAPVLRWRGVTKSFGKKGSNGVAAVGSAFGYAVCEYSSLAGLTDVVLDPVTSAVAGAGLLAVGLVGYLLACSSTLRQVR